MKPSTEAESIDWKSVAIVGEYTVPSGPYFDDHFLVIVLRSGRVVEWPLGNVGSVIPTVEQAIGQKIEFGLCNRTDETSRVIFPPSLFEHPLFDFSRASEPNKILHLLKSIGNFGIGEILKDLTKELSEYLEGLGEDKKRSATP